MSDYPKMTEEEARKILAERNPAMLDYVNKLQAKCDKITGVESVSDLAVFVSDQLALIAMTSMTVDSLVQRVEVAERYIAELVYVISSLGGRAPARPSTPDQVPTQDTYPTGAYL